MMVALCGRPLAAVVRAIAATAPIVATPMKIF
jgi:hypothetical protein